MIHEDDDTLVFDALADARTAAPLWRILAGGETVQLRDGRLSVGGGGLDASATDIAPLAREQSNTSLVVGGEHLLKVMRKLAFEPSVELEMTRALAEAGFDHLAPPQAWLHYERDDRPHGALLAIAQPFLHNGTEGWTLALTSLRDLYADAEEHDPGDAAQRTQAVEDAGGSFTGEAARLGEITAQMHLALAGATGAGPRRRSRSRRRCWRSGPTRCSPSSTRSSAAAATRCASCPPHREALEARITAIRTLHEPGLAIRIHGDYHLGQVLRTDSGLDGARLRGRAAPPRRASPPPPLAAARRRRHAAQLRLRGVGGAARAPHPDATRRGTHLRAHGLSWAAANREAFWAAYVERTAGSSAAARPRAPR